MKTFVIILAVAVFQTETGFCDEDAGYTSHLQVGQGSYTWNISADRLYSTPEWVSEAQPIPLSLDKACKLGRGWLARHGFVKFDLDEARMLSYPGVQSAAMSHAHNRFYYWLMYRSEDFDGSFMYVYVLMDGTVVEPKFTAAPEKKR